MYYLSPSTSLQTPLSSSGLSMIVPQAKLGELQCMKGVLHGASTVFNDVHGGGRVLQHTLHTKIFYLHR